MPGQFYDNALQTQHDAAAAAIDTGPGTLLTFGGPAGKVGRVLDISIDITVALTVTDTLMDIGESGGDVDAQLSDWTLAFTGSGVGDRLAPSRDDSVVALDQGVDIAADTDTIVQTNGAATAGDGDIRVLAAWW